MRLKRNPAADYEAAVAEVMQEFEAKRLEKLRLRAEEILAARGVLSPEEEARRSTTAEVVRQSHRSLGFSYLDEAPAPWSALPALANPRNRQLRLKPIHQLRADGVYIGQRGDWLRMASPVIRVDGEVWAYLPAASGEAAAPAEWRTISVPVGKFSGDTLDALRAAGVELGTAAFPTGGQHTPAWSFVSSWLLDGVHFA